MNEIKSLLWHLDNHTAEGQRLPLVHALARRLEATLEVLYAVTPLPMQFPFAMTAESGAAGQLAACEAEQRRAARAAFERACQAAACTGLHWQATPDEPVRAFSAHAWAADLLVLGQHDPQAEGAAGVPADFVASVLVTTGKPGLVLPCIDITQTPGQNVLVMGCYGHGRAREWALGGVTRTVLQAMTLSVLMAH